MPAPVIEVLADVERRGPWVVCEKDGSPTRPERLTKRPAQPNQLRFTTTDDWLVVITKGPRWIEVEASLPSAADADRLRDQLGL